MTTQHADAHATEPRTGPDEALTNARAENTLLRERVAELEAEKSSWYFTEKGLLRSIREQESELTDKDIEIRALTGHNNAMGQRLDGYPRLRDLGLCAIHVLAATNRPDLTDSLIADLQDALGLHKEKK